jgi:D-arginine dehydrogenase
VVYLAGPDQLDLLDAAYAEILPLNPGVRRLTRDELLAELPCLRPEAVAAGMSEPGAADIDVHALHQGYLRGLRQRRRHPLQCRGDGAAAPG